VGGRQATELREIAIDVERDPALMTQRRFLLSAVLLAGAAATVFPMQAQTAPAAVPSSGPFAPPASTPAAPAAQAPAAQTAAPAAKPDAAGETAAYPVAEIIVRINDQIISKQDLERQTAQLMEQAKEENWTPEEIEKRKAGLLSDLIDQQLLLSRGKELGVSGDDELIRQLDETRKQNHMDSMEDLEKAVRQQGLSFEDFKANIRNGIITRQVIREEVGKSIHMTTAEAQAYYQAHKDQFTQPESVHLSEILLPSGTTDAELAAAKERAEKIAADLSKGSSFGDMAKSVSTGPTASQGGDLGVFKRGQLAKELEDSTFSLKVGEITQPIRTRQGYVILKVTGRTAEGLQPYKDVEEQVQQEAYVERMQPALRTYLTKLREESDIDIKKGYTDINASPNESKPVFSAYTPPQKKSKKVKANKQRYRDKSVMGNQRAAAAPKPPDADDLVNSAAKKTAPGGPTTVASTAYNKTAEEQAANPPPPPAPEVAEADVPAKKKAAKAKSTKPIKVRYGQGEKAAQLPPDPHAAADQPVGDPSIANERAAAVADGTAAADANVESRLTPESQEILGTADAAPQKKTRMQQAATVSRTKKKAAVVATKKRNAPAPPGPDEVAAQAVNSAPLGLNGNTAAKTKATNQTGEKQRLQEKKTEAAAADKPNPGTPGADSVATTPTPAAAPAKKRHKLLGIL
jgi:peptidyl-prolyl cis-trans isomerase SurA